jgi:transketolase
MGSTHHALEDYGTLLSLPNMRVYVPAFDADVTAAIASLMRGEHPAYLRLGLSEQPDWLQVEAFAPWRRIILGQRIVVVLIGALAGGIIGAIRDSGIMADVWLVSQLPAPPPAEFLDSVRMADLLIAVEEHTLNGGFGQMLSHQLLSAGAVPRRFVHRTALGYVSGLYGSQKFHRRECGLDPASVIAEIREADLR